MLSGLWAEAKQEMSPWSSGTMRQGHITGATAKWIPFRILDQDINKRFWAKEWSYKTTAAVCERHAGRMWLAGERVCLSPQSTECNQCNVFKGHVRRGANKFTLKALNLIVCQYQYLRKPDTTQSNLFSSGCTHNPFCSRFSSRGRLINNSQLLLIIFIIQFCRIFHLDNPKWMQIASQSSLSLNHPRLNKP